MKDHAREKDTASWLAQEYGGSNSNSLFITRAGSPEETQLPWPKVQRRLAQLIQEDRFYTEEEQDRFDNIDPIAIREALEERGSVNGQVADPEKQENDHKVMSEVEQEATEETEHKPEYTASDREYALSLIHILYSEKTGKTYDATVVLEDDGQYANLELEFDQRKGGSR